MKRIQLKESELVNLINRVVNEAPTPVDHDEVMKKIDKYCNGDESKMDTSELTGITKELIDTINGYCSAPIA